MSPSKTTAPGLWLHGSSGRMGKEIQKAMLEDDTARHSFRLVGGSALTFEGEKFYQGRAVTPELLAHALAKDEVELILDFSTTDGNTLLVSAMERLTGKAVVIGTTGLAPNQLATWKSLASKQGMKILVAPNTSIGILLAVKAALLVAKPLLPLGFDIEITEAHHRAKLDAPSGTARFLADTLAANLPDQTVVTDRKGARESGEIGVHSVRGGGIFGEHEIRLIGDSEEVTISHRAFSRALFAKGALVLGQWLLKQKPGFYNLFDVNFPSS